MKLTTRCGTAAVDGCNQALLAKAAEAKLLRTSRLRADTTVVPADVAYPTDSGLLARALRRIATIGLRVQAAGGATRTRVRDRSRAAGARAREIGAKLRLRTAQGRDEAQATVRRVTGELAGLAERVVADAQKRLVNARRALRRANRSATERQAAGTPDPTAGRRRGRLRRAVDDLTGLLAATRRIAEQTRQRLSGTTPDGATRRVSLHDPDARPIAKGRLGRPVEFGYKAQVVDNADGVVLDHTVDRGNPPDAPQRAPALANWLPPSQGSSPAPVAARAPSPPTAATARPASKTTYTSWVSEPWSSRARAAPARPDKPPNTVRPSARRSSGAPAAKAGSAASSADTAGTAPASMAWTEYASGPGRRSWPTTWSRSGSWPTDGRTDTITRDQDQLP